MSNNQPLGEILENQISDFQADLSRDVTWVRIILTGHNANKLTIVVVTHFLVDYLLSKIISSKCRNPNKIINYSFSIKLEILYSMSLLSSDNYKNIKKLNVIRNKIVHALEVNIPEKEMIFYKSNGERVKVGKSKSKDPEKFFLNVLSNGILVNLRNYMLLKLKISPNFSIIDQET